MSRKTTTFVWSLSVVIFAIGVSSIEVIGSSTILTSGNSSQETSAADGVLSAEHLDQNDTCGLKGKCKNGGLCVHKDGVYYCKCRTGTSGDQCQVVNECVNNPTKCGNGTDVKCHFNILRGKAECKCNNTRSEIINHRLKHFDYYHKRCTRPCTSSSECRDGQECWYPNSETKHRFCRCPWGIGGRSCSTRIDECKYVGIVCRSRWNNQVYDSVDCIQGTNGEAKCSCYADYKEFNYEVNKCVDCDCGEHSFFCQFFPGGEKYCKCDNNTYYQKDGKCEDCNCGHREDCSVNEYGEKVCKCHSGTANKDGTCVECICESNEDCSFDEDGGKICTCKAKYERLNGVCFECDCGENSYGCSFQNGQKICSCKPDYKQSQQICEKCDCGKNSNGCSFQYGQKICSCKPGYTQFDGSCRRQCSKLESEQCKNGGKCEDSVCQCLSGTSGEICEIVEGCFEGFYREPKCGDYAECLFNQTSGLPFCQCISRNHFFDDYYKSCKECDCGSHGTCSFVRGDKTCKCEKGYSQRPASSSFTISQCEPCVCGTHSARCQYTSYDSIDCHCDLGYAQRNLECQECSCGPNGVCSFAVWGKVCECDSGTANKNGSCVACDCGSDGKCKFNEHGEQICICKSGYSYEGGVCTDIDECKDSSICPEGTECTNTLGSYKCPCKKGYVPHSDNPETKLHGCEEKDECKDPFKCPFRSTSTCINNQGSYYCVCKSGFSEWEGRSVESIGCKFADTESGLPPWWVGFIIFISFSFVIASGARYYVIYKRKKAAQGLFDSRRDLSINVALELPPSGTIDVCTGSIRH